MPPSQAQEFIQSLFLIQRDSEEAPHEHTARAKGQPDRHQMAHVSDVHDVCHDHRFGWNYHSLRRQKSVGFMISHATLLFSEPF